MRFSAISAAASLIGSARAASSDYSSYSSRTYSAYEPSASEIALSASNATSATWKSSVDGLAFKRFVVIWLENTDFDKAATDENMQKLAEQGISLTNYWALTHPSEPNYLASIGGDYFALNDDRFIALPENVSCLPDLLDTKGISWGGYMEHLPYTGFNGFNYSNQETFNPDYVRKHNPLALFDSVTSNKTRLGLIKNFTEFETDLKNENLPQYMIITPNMTNDGHDTSIKVAAQWSYDFISPLLSNEYFMKDTLILLTFDENENYLLKNKVYSILFGGAISDDLKGTTDATFYDHYSQISSCEINWGLPHLGRNDVNANIFEVLANKTNITNQDVDTTYKLNNDTYLGYLLDDQIALPAPNVSATNAAGASILPRISSVWASEYNKQLSESYFTATTETQTTVLSDAATMGRNYTGPVSGTMYESATKASDNSSSSSASKGSGNSSSNSTGSSSASKDGASSLEFTIGSALLVAAGLFLI